MKSERQKSLKRRTILFGVLSYGLLFVSKMVFKSLQKKQRRLSSQCQLHMSLVPY